MSNIFLNFCLKKMRVMFSLDKSKVIIRLNIYTLHSNKKKKNNIKSGASYDRHIVKNIRTLKLEDNNIIM